MRRSVNFCADLSHLSALFMRSKNNRSHSACHHKIALLMICKQAWSISYENFFYIVFFFSVLFCCVLLLLSTMWIWLVTTIDWNDVNHKIESNKNIFEHFLYENMKLKHHKRKINFYLAQNLLITRKDETWMYCGYDLCVRCAIVSVCMCVWVCVTLCVYISVIYLYNNNNQHDRMQSRLPLCVHFNGYVWFSSCFSFLFSFFFNCFFTLRWLCALADRINSSSENIFAHAQRIFFLVLLCLCLCTVKFIRKRIYIFVLTCCSFAYTHITYLQLYSAKATVTTTATVAPNDLKTEDSKWIGIKSTTVKDGAKTISSKTNEKWRRS